MNNFKLRATSSKIRVNKTKIITIIRRLAIMEMETVTRVKILIEINSINFLDKLN